MQENASVLVSRVQLCSLQSWRGTGAYLGRVFADVMALSCVLR